jgi:hypothetical protein
VQEQTTTIEERLPERQGEHRASGINKSASLGDDSVRRAKIFFSPSAVPWKSFLSCGIVRRFPGSKKAGSDCFPGAFPHGRRLFCTLFSPVVFVQRDEIPWTPSKTNYLTLCWLWKSLCTPQWISCDLSPANV